MSLETDGRWLALSYVLAPGTYSSELPGSGIILYDAETLGQVAIAPAHVVSGPDVRHDNIELLGGRLFHAWHFGSKLTVVELDLPSLKTLHTVIVKSDEAGWRRTHLTSGKGHLVALAANMLVELTPELAVVSKRELHADEVALGPASEILTPVGLEAPGKRGDFVPDARASASCTPWWAGRYPLLACNVDMEGIRIARLAPR